MSAANISSAQREAMLAAIELELSRRKIDTMYPDTGPLRRELYAKHMEFFQAGATYRERCAMAANRVGKTEGMGGYETALHLTGRYPEWWEGRRFDKSVRFWAAGKTNETTRDIVQNKLFGRVIGSGTSKCFSGTGLVYADCIERVGWKQGVTDLADTVYIKHVDGGLSELGLKSYQQGRGSFEGTERDGIWLDEEPPLEVYSECLIRTATTNGIVYITFTPLEGTTGTVLMFLEPEEGEVAQELLCQQ